MPPEQKYRRFVQERAVELCRRYGYHRLDTPVFEDASLFIRTVGEGSDIVEKEMYTFQDRGGGLLALRPEGTAPVCRAYLQHGMHNLPQPVRLYYFCPVFRYERPQWGRYREHHQFGIEAVGDASPEVDAEVVGFAWDFVNALGLEGFVILLNSIGDPQCRPGYVQKLKEHYSQHISSLCTDCRDRFERNPLRLLDCKEEACQAVAREAPHPVDSLCPECLEHWERLLDYLSQMGVPYTIDHHLVRGLDYYTRTVFEIQPLGGGTQSTVLGGGRYDGLIQELGGRPTPGVGFASGIERLALNVKELGVAVPSSPGPVVVVHLGRRAGREAVRLVHNLRGEGIATLLAPGSRTLRGQMRYASSLDATYVAILGESELEKSVATLRDMRSGEQQEVPLRDLASLLAGKV